MEDKLPDIKKCKHLVPIVCDWQMCEDPSECPYIGVDGNCHRHASDEACPIEVTLLSKYKTK